MLDTNWYDNLPVETHTALTDFLHLFIQNHPDISCSRGKDIVLTTPSVFYVAGMNDAEVIVRLLEQATNPVFLEKKAEIATKLGTIRQSLKDIVESETKAMGPLAVRIADARASNADDTALVSEYRVSKAMAIMATNLMKL